MWGRGRGLYSYLGDGCNNSATMQILAMYLFDVDPDMHESNCNISYGLISFDIGVGRFRILGGQGLEFWGGGARGGQIPSRHMTA